MGLALAALRAVGRRLSHGILHIDAPGRAPETFRAPQPGPEAVLRLTDPRGVWSSMTNGSCGFGEAYIRGWIDSPAPARLVELAAVNRSAARRIIRGSPLTRIARNWMNRLFRDNTRRGGRRNIAAHYDLGNAFYETWLDPTMTYSSAVFDGPRDDDLVGAQARKYDRMLDDVSAHPDDHLLEIGCGWGGFAEHAAKTRGCSVTALTISPAQHAYARARIQREGLNEKVDIRLQDYRDVEHGAFDKATSIEMFEAVGERHWSTYFEKLGATLKPGGAASLQIITIADELFEEYRRSADFIQKYVFPGGMLPSPTRLRERFRAAGFDLKRAQFFGHDYARTLAAWNDAFQAAWPRIRPMGFDDRFRRMWSFYLAYCEGGFAAGSIDVGRFMLRRA